MEAVKFRFLSQEDVIAVGLTMDDVIKIVGDALKAHAQKRYEMPPKPGVHTRPPSFIHAMPAYLPDLNVCGIKWVSGYPRNYQYNLPQIMGVLILNSTETGAPLCLMDCRWVTALRTAAVSGITAKFCARPDAEVVGIVGAGVQGRYNIRALKTTLPQIKQVKAYDVQEKALNRFVAEISQELKVHVEATKSVEEAVEGSDIVITATARLEKPIVKGEWLKSGSLIMSLESARPLEDGAILKADKFITDDWEQTRYLAEHTGIFPGGLPKLYAELSQIVVGLKPGRENNHEIILAANIGLAIEDIAVGQIVYEKACKKGLGKELTLMEKDI